jgi:hypothetical protein
MDCKDISFFEDWIGDDFCDDGGWGPVLDCIEFDWDGGDCEPPADAFLPSGEYEGEIETDLIVEYGWGGLETRYACNGALTGEIDTDASPQIQASGECESEADGETYVITIEGNFSDEVPSGTIVFTGSEESTAGGWSGSWAYGNLEGEYSGDVDGEWPPVRYEGEFEMDRID